jgi:hypothetical protein
LEWTEIDITDVCAARCQILQLGLSNVDSCEEKDTKGPYSFLVFRKPAANAAGHGPASQSGASVLGSPGANAGKPNIDRAAQDLTSDFDSTLEGQPALKIALDGEAMQQVLLEYFWLFCCLVSL